MNRDDEAAPAPTREIRYAIGEALDTLSVEELGSRIDLLRREIARLDAAAEAKRASRSAADAVFGR